MRLPFILSFFPALLCVACTSAPKAKVTQVAIAEQGPDGGRIVVRVRVKSDSDLPMPMQQLRWRLIVRETDCYELHTSPDATVPPHGDAELVLWSGIIGENLAGREYMLLGDLVFDPHSTAERLKRELGLPAPHRFFGVRGVLAPLPALPLAAPVAGAANGPATQTTSP